MAINNKLYLFRNAIISKNRQLAPINRVNDRRRPNKCDERWVGCFEQPGNSDENTSSLCNCRMSALRAVLSHSFGRAPAGR